MEEKNEQHIKKYSMGNAKNNLKRLFAWFKGLLHKLEEYNQAAKIKSLGKQKITLEELKMTAKIREQQAKIAQHNNTINKYEPKKESSNSKGLLDSNMNLSSSRLNNFSVFGGKI